MMIILITGATHSGKTLLAQRMLEKYAYPYFSQDHLKMGLIRSAYTSLSPDSPDAEITDYLWPVTREIVKTAIENKQNLIIEGCYIPFSWKNDFDNEYLAEIRYICLCFSESYITEHYSDIIGNENVIENRIDDGYCTVELLQRENKRFRDGCSRSGLPFVLIDKDHGEALSQVLQE